MTALGFLRRGAPRIVSQGSAYTWRVRSWAGARAWAAGAAPAALGLMISAVVLPPSRLGAQVPQRGATGGGAVSAALTVRPGQVSGREPAAAVESTAAVSTAATSTAETPAPARTIADSVERAVRTYHEMGTAVPVTIGPVTAFPFGRGMPTLVCTVLRACTIELQAGETITDSVALADPVRWARLISKAGPGGAMPLVIVKPKDCDLTTNVVIPTDRRIYDITLESPPCKAGTTNPPGLSVRQLRFYYPDDSARGAGAAAPAALTAEAKTADTVDLRLVRVNRDYKLPRKPKFPWKPAEVFDDGAHVYIRVPESARHEAAPVLYALEDDGTRTLVNYTVRDDLYVTDRTFRRGLLVLGGGKHEQTLEIENRAWGKVRLPAGGH